MKRFRWIVLLGLAAVGVAGCGQQSFDEGMRVICHSTKEINEAQGPGRAAAASKWIFEHLDNEEALSLWKSLAPLAPEQKASTIREAASRAGLSQCPVADIWTPHEEG